MAEHTRSIRTWPCIALLASLLAVHPPGTANTPELILAGIELPVSAPQGAMVRGRAPPGSRVEVGGRSVRIAEDGRFVFGIGRDDTGPLDISIVPPQGDTHRIALEVHTRRFRIERVDGVPQSTVTPNPALAERIAREQARVTRARELDDARTDWNTTFIWPIRGRISGVFGSQRIYNGVPRAFHSGLDVAAPTGTPLRAPAAGVVTFVAPDLYLTGGTVLIDHGHGISSNFLHLSRIDVAVGERVEQGQVFGAVGATGRATGPHMHWGMNWFGVRIDPQLLLDDAD